MAVALKLVTRSSTRSRILNRCISSQQQHVSCQKHAHGTSCSLPPNPFTESIAKFSSAGASPIYDEHDHHDNIDEQYDKPPKHCQTCTCDDHDEQAIHDHDEPAIHDASTIRRHVTQHICQDDFLKNDLPLPPPLPEPKYSFHRRIMPSSLIQSSSPEGRHLFKESLSSGMAEAFFPLSEQFLNQSDPAYCGVTTLIMVLNAIGIDPNVRWKGGWRWYGSEEMILDSCCIDPERVQRAGILLEEFQSLARCQGLRIDMKRPFPLEDGQGLEKCANPNPGGKTDWHGLDEFRKDIVQMVRNPPIFHREQSTNAVDTEGGFVVVSFSRSALGQTGDGHFSPIAAYSEETDRCLVLDVARFKYAPYWVSIKDLYESTRPEDPTTNKSRGWFIMYPPRSVFGDNHRSVFKGTRTLNEAQRPADIVPLSGEETKEQLCPVGDIKVQYCAVNSRRDRSK